MIRVILIVLLTTLISCSTVKDVAVSAVKGAVSGVTGASDKGGITASLDVQNADGDINNEQDITTEIGHTETNTDVEAQTVADVGNNKQQAETIVNEELPPRVLWLIVGLVISIFISICLPTPTRMWKFIFRTK